MYVCKIGCCIDNYVMVIKAQSTTKNKSPWHKLAEHIASSKKDQPVAHNNYSKNMNNCT